MIRKDLEYNGQPVEILDIDGRKRFVDFEHIANNKTRFARLLTKYKNKWYFSHMNGVGLLLINKENIKQVLI